MLTVTKEFDFSYAHRLPGYKGDCANLHGHNSKVEVAFQNVSGMPRPYDGMIVDFKDIKRIVGPIIDRLDHTCLNDHFALNPTAENITKWIVNQILKTEIGMGLARVRVSETDDSFAEWTK